MLNGDREWTPALVDDELRVYERMTRAMPRRRPRARYQARPDGALSDGRLALQVRHADTAGETLLSARRSRRDLHRPLGFEALSAFCATALAPGAGGRRRYP